MKKVNFLSGFIFVKLVAFVLFYVVNCSVSAPIAAAQSSQSNFTVITPGTPFFAVSGAYYQVTVPTGNLTAYTVGDSDTVIQIYDKSAKQIAENDDVENADDYNARVSIPVEAGTFFIRVTYADGSGPYVLQVDK